MSPYQRQTTKKTGTSLLSLAIVGITAANYASPYSLAGQGLDGLTGIFKNYSQRYIMCENTMPEPTNCVEVVTYSECTRTMFNLMRPHIADGVFEDMAAAAGVRKSCLEIV